MKKFTLLLFFLTCLSSSITYSKNELYEKIDLWRGIRKYSKDYVDDVDQSEMMDSAINGVLNLLIRILPT